MVQCNEYIQEFCCYFFWKMFQKQLPSFSRRYLAFCKEDELVFMNVRHNSRIKQLLFLTHFFDRVACEFNMFLRQSAATFFGQTLICQLTKLCMYVPQHIVINSKLETFCCKTAPRELFIHRVFRNLRQSFCRGQCLGRSSWSQDSSNHQSDLYK